MKLQAIKTFNHEPRQTPLEWFVNNSIGIKTTSLNIGQQRFIDRLQYNDTLKAS